MGLFDGLFKKKEENKVITTPWKQEEDIKIENEELKIENEEEKREWKNVIGSEIKEEEVPKEDTKLELEIEIEEAETKEVEIKEVETEMEIEVKPEVEIKSEDDQEDEKYVIDKSIDEVIEEKQNFFQKLVKGLSKTKSNIVGNIDNILKNFTKIDEDLFEELEEQLIIADIGVAATMDIINQLRESVKSGRIKEPAQIKEMLKEEIIKILINADKPNDEIVDKKVLLIIGVNGVGKTTSVGKLAHQYRKEGKRVLLAAADTFRAAATEQLTEWANRANIEIIKHNEGADPGAVVFDALQAAKSRKTDVLIVDTAGRLHNKKNLMDELRKIYKIIDKEYEGANKEMLLVLDSTTGQNALQQAKLFGEIIDINGLILTKLDGTAKGGIVVAISKELKIPVRYIGVGEGIEDLQKFDAEKFANAIFE